MAKKKDPLTHVVTLRGTATYYDGATKFFKDQPVSVTEKVAEGLEAREPKKFEVKTVEEVEAKKEAQAKKEAKKKEGSEGGAS